MSLCHLCIFVHFRRAFESQAKPCFHISHHIGLHRFAHCALTPQLTSELNGILEPDQLEHVAERSDKDNQQEGKERDATIVRTAKESIVDEGPPDSGKSAATVRLAGQKWVASPGLSFDRLKQEAELGKRTTACSLPSENGCHMGA